MPIIVSVFASLAGIKLSKVGMAISINNKVYNAPQANIVIKNNINGTAEA